MTDLAIERGSRDRRTLSPTLSLRTGRGSKSAFTLVELLLVLAILTLVVATIAPSLRGFASGRTHKHMANTVLAMTKYARTQAIAEGRVYRLNVDNQDKALWLTCESGSTFVAPGNLFTQQIEVSEGLRMQADIAAKADGGRYIEFRPGGRTDAAHIRLTNRDGEVIEIASHSPTEAFRILSPEELAR
jgi:type II secretion system protein H